MTSLKDLNKREIRDSLSLRTLTLNDGYSGEECENGEIETELLLLCNIVVTWGVVAAQVGGWERIERYTG